MPDNQFPAHQWMPQWSFSDWRGRCPSWLTASPTLSEFQVHHSFKQCSNQWRIHNLSILNLSSMNYYYSTMFCFKSVMMLSEKWMYLRPTIMGTISQKIYWGSPCTTALHQQLINNLYSIQGTIYHKNNSIFWFWSYKYRFWKIHTYILTRSGNL